MNDATNPNAVWSCKVGPITRASLPDGADAPMRAAVAKAFKELTGYDNEFLFSGWDGGLTDREQDVVEDRLHE